MRKKRTVKAVAGIIAVVAAISAIVYKVRH